MDTIIDPKEFALAVVSSKSFDGTVEEISVQSLELYKSAYITATSHNKPIIEEDKKRRQENSQAFLDAFGK